MSFNDEPESDDMDSLELDFIPAEVKRTSMCVPTGEYVVLIEDIKPRSNQDEDIVNFCPKLRIDEGEHANKVVFGRHCAKTTREGDKADTMLRIGREQLGELARAAGAAGASLAPCVGQRVIAKVRLRPEANGYPESNEVTGYKPLAGAAAPKAAPSTTSKAAAPAASKPSFYGNRKA
jgi:hypothetical protein